MFVRLLFLFYISIISFYPALSFFSIGGFPIITVLNILVFFLCIVFFLTRIRNSFQFFLIFSIILSFSYSIAIGWDITKCITNLCLYVIPVLIIAFVEKTNLTLKLFINIMTISLLISALLSVLALVGVLTKTSNYYINIYYVDGASGIIGIVLCVYMALSPQKEYKRINILVLGISGVIIVLLGQSRARFLVGLISCIMVLFLVAYTNKSRHNNKTGRKVLFFIVASVIIAFIVYHSVPQLSKYVDNILIRIRSLWGNDENVAFRNNESKLYINMFKEKPIMGVGWGVLNNSNFLNYNGEQYMAHNMFSSLMGVGGLLFCFPYFLYLLLLLRRMIHEVMIRKNRILIPGLVALCDVIMLGIGSSGFGKLSGVLFMTLAYTVMLESGKYYKKKF